MDQQVAFRDNRIGVVGVDDGASHAVFLTETDDAALDACLREVGIVYGDDVVADPVAVGEVRR
jgi:hypothetical protein